MGWREQHPQADQLKAADQHREALPHFFQAMTNEKEPRQLQGEGFEVVSRSAGLGNPELIAAGNGQFFKLEINLGGGKPPWSRTSLMWSSVDTYQ